MANLHARAVLAFTLGVAVLAAAPTSAATRSFSIPVTSVTDGSAAFFQTGVIGLPDGISTSAYINFTVPADYKAGSPVLLRFYMSNLNAPCAVSFGASFLARNRAGTISAEYSNPDASAGLPGGSMASINFAAANKIVVKTYKIQPATTGGITTQKPGDGIVLVFRRGGADSGDNCGGYLDLQNIEVRYTTP